MMETFKAKYAPLDDDESVSSTGEIDANIRQLLHRQWPPQPQWAMRLFALLPWVSTLAFASLSLILYFRQFRTTSSLGTYEAGFRTDLTPPNGVPLEAIRFTGTVHFMANGSMYREDIDPLAPWPENLELFGEPNPTIDANWARILEGRYFSISIEDAKRAWGDQYLDFVNQLKGGWTAGFEVFHSLHCLNTVRQGLRPDYYPDAQNQVHIDHCLNSIRQTIQCQGSTTLVPTRYWEGAHHNYIDADQVHTCRSFSYLRDYLDTRQPGEKAYVDPDMSVIDGGKNALAKEFMKQYKEDHERTDV